MISEKIFLKKIKELEGEFEKTLSFYSHNDKTIILAFINQYKDQVINPAIEAARDATLEILQNETDRIEGEISVLLDEIDEEDKKSRGF